MKKAILYSFILLILPLVSKAQVTRIDYERKVSWSRIMQTLPYMSKEEKDRMRMSWGRGRSEPDPYYLLIDSVQSLYQLDEDNLPQNEYSWRRDKFVVHTRYKDKRKLDNVETLGKSFVFDEELPKMKWKILNEIKEVAGYVCMKAQTSDTVKQQLVTAWFTYEIPLPLGPENYHGLPGLILEVSKNDDCAVITATKINLKGLTQPIHIPKKKGKKTTTAKFESLVSRHIRESIAAQRNPFWSIMY